MQARASVHQYGNFASIRTVAGRGLRSLARKCSFSSLRLRALQYSETCGCTPPAAVHGPEPLREHLLRLLVFECILDLELFWNMSRLKSGAFVQLSHRRMTGNILDTTDHQGGVSLKVYTTLILALAGQSLVEFRSSVDGKRPEETRMFSCCCRLCVLPFCSYHAGLAERSPLSRCPLYPRTMTVHHMPRNFMMIPFGDDVCSLLIS